MAIANKEETMRTVEIEGGDITTWFLRFEPGDRRIFEVASDGESTTKLHVHLTADTPLEYQLTVSLIDGTGVVLQGSVPEQYKMLIVEFEVPIEDEDFLTITRTDNNPGRLLLATSPKSKRQAARGGYGLGDDKCD